MYLKYFKKLIYKDGRKKMENTIVNSWNEWDPLKHVIVGRADGSMVQAPELAVQRDWPNHGFPLNTYGELPKEMEIKANEQIDNFIKILELRGIRVDRPTPINFNQTVETPDWKQDSMVGCMPPRDVLLTIGNEILEATMSYRSRWHEYLCYRPLLEKYFKEDPNFRWEAAPKPRLDDHSYKKDFMETWNALNKEERIERAIKADWILTEAEPLFDAASITRFGKDIFMEHSTVTNLAGLNWLKRHFPNHRVHKALMVDETEWPVHMDATWVPLRPGLVLANRVRPPIEKSMIDLYEKNDWEIIQCAKPAHDKPAILSHCSEWLSMNCIVLDTKTICVNADETAQMEQLYKLGFEVIPIDFYDVSAFGGGLHCVTADVYREGTCEDYFPKQIEGF